MMAQLGNNRNDGTLVTTPNDMARVLFKASAFSAAAYALAAHEEACEQGNDQRIEFWRDVCAGLRTLRDALDQTPARNAA